MALSIKKELRGSVLLTGGIGFLGSVCLEQMLALTEVSCNSNPRPCRSDASWSCDHTFLSRRVP